MSRRRKSDNALLWQILAVLIVLGIIVKYWYISLPIGGLIVLSVVADAYQKDKRKQAMLLQARREREQRAWANHWVPAIDRQADLVKMYSTLDPHTADIQRDVLQGLNRYGWACVALAKAEAQ